MVFAFDYDGTIRDYPDLWVPTMKLAQIQGNRVVIATGRSNRNDEDRVILELFCLTHDLRDVDFFFCGSAPKRKVLEEAGILVSVWIDDNPAMVDFGYDGLEKAGEFNGAERR